MVLESPLLFGALHYSRAEYFSQNITGAAGASTVTLNVSFSYGQLSNCYFHIDEPLRGPNPNFGINTVSFNVGKRVLDSQSKIWTGVDSDGIYLQPNVNAISNLIPVSPPSFTLPRPASVGVQDVYLTMSDNQSLAQVLFETTSCLDLSASFNASYWAALNLSVWIPE